MELDWWDSHPVQAPGGTVDVVLAPAQHWSARGLGDRMATLWGGFALFGPDFHLFFAGDTAYSREFSALRARYAERQSEALGAVSTSPCCPSAPMSRAGSCATST